MILIQDCTIYLPKTFCNRLLHSNTPSKLSISSQFLTLVFSIFLLTQSIYCEILLFSFRYLCLLVLSFELSVFSIVILSSACLH